MKAAGAYIIEPEESSKVSVTAWPNTQNSNKDSSSNPEYSGGVMSHKQATLEQIKPQPVKITKPALNTIGMPNSGHTTEFPRVDNMYKNKESIPFDEHESIVWKQRDHDDSTLDEFKLWVAHALCGLLIGVTTFFMDKIEEFLVDVNRGWAQQTIDRFEMDSVHRVYLPWLHYTAFCVLIGTCAGYMSVYHGSGAIGSGVAEMIGYLNGVNNPNFIGVATLITKVLGTVMAVSARLCIGKEGPLAHIGSIWGAAVAYIPGLGFEFMRNDYFKRALISGGASAGAAAAFGAPIGGALFSYEMSKSSEF